MKKSISQCLAMILLPVQIVFCFCGCSRYTDEPVTPLCSVVTAITVTFENGPIHAQRHYTASDKMQLILNYLRLLQPYGSPDEDPETAQGSDFRIVLSYSDGCQKTYRQKGDRFMQNTEGIWKKIDPAKAAELSRIMGQTESDGTL